MQSHGVEAIMSMGEVLTLLPLWAQGGWEGHCARELKEGRSRVKGRKES